ncbi:MAG TPA: hypothetical protein PKO06_21590, partial [Candidatus Ozemobacteraceae bacterium]|nr:hypothetical protein [Candidatus Ozemobacteraceae bacterium]
MKHDDSLLYDLLNATHACGVPIRGETRKRRQATFIEMRKTEWCKKNCRWGDEKFPGVEPTNDALSGTVSEGVHEGSGLNFGVDALFD